MFKTRNCKITDFFKCATQADNMQFVWYGAETVPPN